MRLHFGFQEEFLAYNIKKEIYVDTALNSMLLAQGMTGSGKTFFIKRMLGYIEHDLREKNENATIILCDFKGDDSLRIYSHCSNYYAYDDCVKGIDKIYEIFKARQDGTSNNRNFVMMIFDEYASFLESLEKKDETEVRKKISMLVMMARSFNMSILFSLQAGYSDIFNKIRNNISCVLCMSNMSKELKQMFYSTVSDEVKNNKTRGMGSLLLDGNKLYNIVVPRIKDTQKLDSYIVSLLNRSISQ